MIDQIITTILGENTCCDLLNQHEVFIESHKKVIF